MSRRYGFILLPILLLPIVAFAQDGTEIPPTRLERLSITPPPAPELDMPGDVATTDDNEIFVADRGELRIVKYLSDGTPLLQWGSDGTAPGEFYDIYSLAWDDVLNELYVGDQDRIQVFSADGVFQRQWALPGTGGDFIPWGIDVDADGYVYIALEANYDGTDFIWKCTNTGVTVASWAGSNGTFDRPRDVAVDSQGRVYVADEQNHRVQFYSTTGTYLGEWDSGYPWDIGEVFCLAIDARDNVYVGDMNSSPKIARDGTLLSRLGLEMPMGMDVFGEGTLYASNEHDRAVDKWGYPPPWTYIADVSGDQGRWLRLSWKKSELDRLNLPGVVTGYGIYRRSDYKAAPLPQIARPEQAGAKGLGGWDIIGTVPARGDTFYSYVAPTLADFIIDGPTNWSVFVVSAITGEGVYWDAPADSSFSMDNIPPPVLGAPTVVEDPGQYELELSWASSTAPDLDHYAVYRGETSDFLPASAGDTYATTTAPYYTDSAVASGETWYYRIGVFDDAELFSGFSTASGAQVISGIVPDLPDLGLAQNVPNPFNPGTEIRFRLGRDDEHVTLDVFRVDGSLVVRLVDEVLPGGSRSVHWDGRDGAGRRVASGSYFYRLRAGDFVQTKRMTLLK